MKKLNKLLMPVVGLSTIAATAIPLAACSKNEYTDGVEVTKKEFQEAFAYLAACKEGASWKTSDEDVIQALSVDNGTGEVKNWAEYYNIAFNDDYGTAKAIGQGRAGTSYETQAITSIRKNNSYFTFSKELNSEEKTAFDVYIDPTSEIQGMLVEIASFYYEYYDELTFDKDTKTYIYSGSKQEGTTIMYAQSKVRFDSNKKITYINTHYGQIETDETTVMDVVLHPKYDNVKVDVDQKYIDIANSHSKEMTNNSLDVLKSDIKIEGMTDKAPLLVNITPKNGSETKLTISCKEKAGWTSAHVNGIYKNGEQLEYDTDYTVANNVITFIKGLETTDKIEVGYELRSISDSEIATFQLALA